VHARLFSRCDLLFETAAGRRESAAAGRTRRPLASRNLGWRSLTRFRVRQANPRRHRIRAGSANELLLQVFRFGSLEQFATLDLAAHWVGSWARLLRPSNWAAFRITAGRPLCPAVVDSAAVLRWSLPRANGGAALHPKSLHKTLGGWRSQLPGRPLSVCSEAPLSLRRLERWTLISRVGSSFLPLAPPLLQTRPP
jgi:hypothetical protein